MTGPLSKTLGVLALTATVATAGAVQAQTSAAAAKPPVMLRADACLREKVDRVVADEPEIASAADFLVNYACADEVAGATRYLRSQAYLQLFTGLAKVIATSAANKPPAASGDKAPPAQQNPAATAAAAASVASIVASMMKVDPETGEMRVTMPGPQGAQANDVLRQSTSIIDQFAPDKVPTSLRKLAGDLVLEARERRRAK